MKRILIRASVLPYEELKVDTCLFDNSIWGNSGNLLFVYGVLRNIYSEDLRIEAYKKGGGDERDAEWINENYDMFLIPLANAFRNDFISALDGWTRLIKKLTIPCIVIGVGIQAEFEPDMSKGFVFDNSVKAFVEAVLEKSVSIGVRGALTAEYLKRLGVSENKIEVIGCPSMFSLGDFIPRKYPHYLEKDSIISICYHGMFNNYFEFLERVKKEFQDYYIVTQCLHDLKLLYAGDRIKEKVHSNYVRSIDRKEYQENRIRQFINVPSWVDFLRNVDVSIGSCIHGTIAATLAGNPAIVFAADARVRELSEYHHLSMVKMSDINEKTDLRNIYEKFDFSDVTKGHDKRYKTFINFLEKNGVSVTGANGNIYTEFDRKVMEAHMDSNGIQCTLAVKKEEGVENLKKYLKYLEKKIKWYSNQLSAGKSINVNGFVNISDSLKCTIDNMNVLENAINDIKDL